MAIEPLTAPYKTLTFDGETAASFGVQILGKGTFNAPKRDVEMIAIPGRSGDLALDKGRFENIEVKYPARLIADSTEDFADAISAFRNFLCSRKGYCRLSDDYNPDEYRMAVYSRGLEADVDVLKAGKFDIVFDCKPQRWLKSGETAVTIGEWGETETASGDIVTVENEDGGLAVKSLGVDLEPIQDLNGYDNPWAGGAGKNKLKVTATAATASGITVTVNADGTFTANGTASGMAVFNINYTLGDYLTVGTQYILSGCTGGNYGTTYGLQLSTDNGSTKAINNNGDTAFTMTSDTTKLRLLVWSGAKLNNQVFKPMIRLASDTDATFEPYENICPISGHTEVDTKRTGKNLFDNVWESGIINATTGQNAVNSSYQRGANYLKVTPNTAYSFSYKAETDLSILVYIYDETKTYIGTAAVTIANGGTYTTNADTHYIRVRPRGTISEIPDPSMQIELGSEATAYEPYQGNTYTTALGRTVYGGTLDVTSGVLTVDRAMVDLGTLSWAQDDTAVSGASRFYASMSPTAKPADSVNLTAISSAYSLLAPGGTYSASATGFTIASDGRVFVYDASTKSMTASAFKTYVNGAQLVYKLATPQTYQLTAQQIELLTGTNNIWSDSGDVTVEYGQNPSILVNPTLFESSPLLRIWGYGTVGFNGYEIELENDVLGNIVLLDAQTRAVAGTSTKLPQNLMNVGDPFTLDASSFFWAFSFDRTRIANVNIRSVSDSDSSQFRSEKSGDGYYTNVSPLDFVYGTDSAISNISTIQATYTDRDDHTGTFTLRLVTQIRYYAESGYLAYTRNISELPGSWLSMDYKSNLSTRGQVVGDSTVSVLGSPTIIDCDLGEAYKYAGSPISLNRYVDLGSDLPTLAPGKNEITYDDTITQLRIVPNWWKI